MNKKSFVSYWMSMMICALFIGIGTFNFLGNKQARIDSPSRGTSEKYSMTEEQKARKRRDLEGKLDTLEREYRRAEQKYKTATKDYENMVAYNQSLARKGIKDGYYTDVSIRSCQSRAKSAYKTMQDLLSQIKSVRNELSHL